MHVTTAAGHRTLLTYCANVHPGERLDDVLRAVEVFIGPVRRRLGAPRLGAGLWLSRTALSELSTRGATQLRRALDAESLFAFTFNGFPYGDFQARRVKRRVYHPDWTREERLDYSVRLAEVLAELLPDDLDDATISTLPLGHREEMPAEHLDTALEQVCRTASALAAIRDRTGKCIRLCLEPEPGCWLETTEQTVELLGQRLPEAAQRIGVLHEHIATHVGVCFDACHQAVAFEDARESLGKLEAAGITIGKVQLSNAIEVKDPGAAGARRALDEFREPRFLHQVRAKNPDGTLESADDLDQTECLPTDRPWRVHFHVPIHRDSMGELGTTRDFLEQTLRTVAARSVLPHLEVETYTWSVLPPNERPRGDEDLVEKLARELEWARARLHGEDSS